MKEEKDEDDLMCEEESLLKIRKSSLSM